MSSNFPPLDEYGQPQEDEFNPLKDVYQPRFQQDPGPSPLNYWARQPRLTGLIAALIANKQNQESTRAQQLNQQEEFRARQSMSAAQMMENYRLRKAQLGKSTYGQPVFVQDEQGNWRAIPVPRSGPNAGKTIEGAVPPSTVTQSEKPEPQPRVPTAFGAAYSALTQKLGHEPTMEDIVNLARSLQPPQQPPGNTIVMAPGPTGEPAPVAIPTRGTPNATPVNMPPGFGNNITKPGAAKGPSTAQTEGIAGLKTVIGQVNDVMDELNNVTGGGPPTSATGQLVDAAKQRAAEFGYNTLGVTSDRSKLIQKVAFLKAERTKMLLKGVRNQKYIDQIWKHMPDENKDSTALMAEKLAYVAEKLNDALETEQAAAQNPQAFVESVKPIAGGVPEQPPSVQKAPRGNQPQFKSEIEFRKAYARDHNGVQPSPDKVAKAKSLGMF